MKSVLRAEGTFRMSVKNPKTERSRGVRSERSSGEGNARDTRKSDFRTKTVRGWGAGGGVAPREFRYERGGLLYFCFFFLRKRNQSSTISPLRFSGLDVSRYAMATARFYGDKKQKKKNTTAFVKRTIVTGLNVTETRRGSRPRKYRFLGFA